MTSVATRRTWQGVGSFLAVAMLAFGTLQVVGLLASTTAKATSSFDGVRHLVIRNGAGGVRLSPSPTSTLQVRRTVTRGLTKPAYSERLDGDRLTLSANCPATFSSFCDVGLVVAVPAGVDVDASGGGGSVRAEGLDASLRLRSSGGGITVVGGGPTLDLDSSGGSVHVDKARAGDVKVHSSGGGVQIRFAVVPADVDARSSGGGVTVELPDGPTAYRVDATSSGGSAHTLVRTDPSSDRRITAKSSGGGVTVRYPPAP